MHYLFLTERKFIYLQPDYEILREHCNLWRNWDDIQNSWKSMINIANWFGDNQLRIQQYGGPGHWNDPDMVYSINGFIV